MRVSPLHSAASLPIVREWLPQHKSTYTAEKLLALDNFISTATRWRVAMLLVLTPLPGLVAATLPSFIPLQAPLAMDGLRGNPGFVGHVFLSAWVVFYGMLLHFRAGSKLHPDLYSFRHILVASFIATMVQTVIACGIISLWTFPMPMTWIVASFVIPLSLAVPHLILFRQRCWRDPRIYLAIRRYTPAMLLQSFQIVVYPAFSVLFDRASPTSQVFLTLAFPLVKFVLKRTLRLVCRGLEEFETEVAVSGIEISASLYQSMIMQSSPSTFAIAIIMGVDVLQGMATVKMFMDRPVVDTPRHLIVREAVNEVKALTCHPVVVAGSKANTDVTNSRKFSPVVRQALRLVDVAESILLIEYFEVAVPIVNTLFLAVTTSVPSTQYNMRLRYLYFHPSSLRHALATSVLYSMLQWLSLLAMHVVMKYRYGMSATYHLAFVIEYHWQSIVGKMVGWQPVILHFTLIHYGVDFSFRFHFDQMLSDRNR